MLKLGSKIILNNLNFANTFLQRLFGLMFKKYIPEDFGLCFPKCTQIHTFFMLTNIDVIFLDENKKIVKIYQDLKPMRITKYIKEGKKGFVIETFSGFSKKYNLSNGDKLEF